jgi:hypothetical protein
MRGFIIASILFSIMTTGILINYWYTSLFHQEIVKLVEDLSEEPSKENAKIIQDIMTVWNKRSVWLSISSERKDLSSIKSHIDELYIYNLYEDKLQMVVSKNQLLNSIDSLLYSEKSYRAAYLKQNFSDLPKN